MSASESTTIIAAGPTWCGDLMVTVEGVNPPPDAPDDSFRPYIDAYRHEERFCLDTLGKCGVQVAENPSGCWDIQSEMAIYGVIEYLRAGYRYGKRWTEIMLSGVA